MTYSEKTEQQKEACRAACRRWAAKNDRSAYYKEYEGQRGNRAQRITYKMWWNARKRAEVANVPFNIEEADIVLSDKCPVCKGFMGKVEGARGGSRSSHTLDRIRPTEGYVKGNVAVICKHCNSQKGDATANELRRIADWIEENS